MLPARGHGLDIIFSAEVGYLSEYGIHLFEFLIVRGLILKCF